MDYMGNKQRKPMSKYKDSEIRTQVGKSEEERMVCNYTLRQMLTKQVSRAWRGVVQREKAAVIL